MKKRKKFIEDFNYILPEYKNSLPINVYEDKKFIKTDSWFDIYEYTTDEITNKFNYKTSFPKEVINSVKIKMNLNKNQKDIIQKWMEVHTNMYNEALKYIKTNSIPFRNEIIKSKLNKVHKNDYNFQKIRNELKTIKQQLINNSQLKNIDKNTKIQAHNIDYAIRQLSSNIQSAITNLRNGHIKKFRIKYWKHTRPSKTIEIEKQYIINNKICPNILGDINYEYNNDINYNLPKITSNVKINYNDITKEYLLIIPFKNIPKKINNKSNNLISLDPGLRTFMTGLSENKQIDIAL